MKKFIILLSILFLLIFTTLIKNSTKKIEKKIYDTKENIRVLNNKHEMVLLEFSYLSSPDRLMKYHSKHFKKELKKINLKNLKIIKIEKHKIITKNFIGNENE